MGRILDLGLNHAERKAFDRALRDSTMIRVQGWLLNSNERERAQIGGRDSIIVDGQVDIDARADVTRSAWVTILDPRARFHLDPRSPKRTSIWPDHLLRLRYDVWVDELDRWVRCPIFWGPISAVEREGPLLHITALGKESLHRDPHLIWRGRNFRKGMGMVDAIEKLLRHKGERRFDFPDIRGRRLRRRASLSRHQEAWRVAQRWANSLDRQLYFDGRGKARLRRLPRKPGFTFSAVDRRGVPLSNVITLPTDGIDFGHFRNLIEVLGPEPEGTRRRIRAVRRLNARNPLSANKLRLNGEPIFAVHVIEDWDLKRKPPARRRAANVRDRRGRLMRAEGFDALPAPHLEELDLVRLVTEDDTLVFRMQRWSLPLVIDGVMPVGANRRVRARRRRRAA